MALLDLSELMTDPDFVEFQNVTVLRTTQVVGNDGIAVNTPKLFKNIVASVQPASGDQQRLLAETTRAEGSISIYTRFRLQQISPSYAGDQILWAGQTYTVENVNDYGNWGRGFQQAVCSLKSLVNPDGG